MQRLGLKQFSLASLYRNWAEGTSLAAKNLRANGITLFKVCEETIKLLGKADMWFFSPEHPIPH
ncbi:unnamed protein product [Prunus armeniaca]|uniref:Uncharacterized protein n=1 Tax=Prunus armeniaca TaxID=36596 RepID=A0A6J5XFB9_PRUAR|nr:unnamed protein product [Prunus armeniaca]